MRVNHGRLREEQDGAESRTGSGLSLGWLRLGLSWVGLSLGRRRGRFSAGGVERVGLS